MTDEILNETPEETNPDVSDDIQNENTEETMEDEGSDEDLKEKLKKRLELELGLPLTPKPTKKVEPNFDDDLVMVEDYPIQRISTFRIGKNTLGEGDYILDESKGIIYLNNHYNGLLYLEYCYGLDEDEYDPLLDLMVEYETDTGWNKNASSIKENNVTVNYDTSLGKGALIRSMIDDLRNKYSCVVEMI